MAYLSAFLSTFAPYLFGGLAITGGLVGIWALRSVAKKFGIDASAASERVIWNAAQSAVAYAEEWAAKVLKFDPAAAPTGAQKLQVALEFIKGALDAAKVEQYGEEQLTRILEAALHVTRPTLTSATSSAASVPPTATETPTPLASSPVVETTPTTPDAVPATPKA